MGRAETGHGAGWRHKLIMCLKIDNHSRVGFVEMGGWTEAAHYIIISLPTQGDQYLCPPPSSGLPAKKVYRNIMFHRVRAETTVLARTRWPVIEMVLVPM